MGYRRAEQILPDEIIRLIQDYIDGECIYIPRRTDTRRSWGEGTNIRKELRERNTRIYEEHKQGVRNDVLARRYYLSEKSIQRIIRNYEYDSIGCR